MGRNKWTEEEDQILKDNYNILTDDKLAELLPNRTRSSVYARRKILGLNKSVHKLSFKDVIEEINKRGYILLSDEADYRDVHSKMRYICPKHKDKGEQRIDLGHLRSGRGCYYCGRERSIRSRLVDIDKENDRKIVENKGIIYVDSYRKDGKMYIDYICPKHYEIGTQTMNRNYMLKHAVGCAYCHGHSLPEWYIRKKISEINPDIELLESYENMTKRIKCRCKKHNHISTKSVQEILINAVDEVATDALVQGISEHDIQMIARPSLDIEAIDEKSVTLVYDIQVKPEVKLGDYTDLGIKKDSTRVLKKDIEEQISRLQERYAELEEILSRTLQFLEDDTQSVGYIKTVADENTVKETFEEFLKNLYLGILKESI